MPRLELVADLGLHAQRRSVGARAGTKARRAKHAGQPAIVIAIARLGKPKVEYAPRGIHVELRHEVKALHARGRRNGWEKELDRHWRIVGQPPANRSWTAARASAWTGARPPTA